MKKIIWLLVIGILFTLTNCTQKERATNHVQPIYARAATYQPGSYYVFRDSVTNGLDSFYVSAIDTSIYFTTDTWEETIYTVFKNNANNQFEFIGASTYKSLNFSCSWVDGANFNGFIYGFDLYPNYIENGYKNSNSCFQIHDSIRIDNHDYFKVCETLFQIYGSGDTSYIHKFYSLQDGLIKLRIHGNGVDKVYTTLRHLQLN